MIRCIYQVHICDQVFIDESEKIVQANFSLRKTRFLRLFSKMKSKQFYQVVGLINMKHFVLCTCRKFVECGKLLPSK